MKRQLAPPLVISLVLAFAACARPLATGALTAGVAAARQDGWEEAARQWKAVLERDPGSAAAHNNLAIAYEKQGAWEEARREYEEARRLAPDDKAIKGNFEAFMARLASGRGKRP
ncbi:MAG: tetratricopeptide repeat protein [Candidatus Aminicenantes bacterium]|nr:MAG: tetratricopeptide repeat protein [Candidatus Aminicenantes bacterium]